MTIVGLGLRLRVTDCVQNTTVERVFTTPTVRVGRDPLNDLVLEHPLVSKFHAQLAIEDDSVFVKDLQSRNGTFIGNPPQRIAAQAPLPLASCGYAFSLAIFRIEVAAVLSQLPTVREERNRGGALLTLAGRSPLEDAQQGAVPVADAFAFANEARTVAEGLAAHHERYRASWNALYATLSQRLGALSPAARGPVLRMLGTAYPGLKHEPEFQRLCDQFGVGAGGPSGAAGASAPREESVAFEVLRELAGWYGVDAPRTATDVVEFARKIQDALDVLFSSFVPLRDNLKQFEQHFGMRGSNTTQQSRLPVVAAPAPKDVAVNVLGWRDPIDHAREMRGVFADLVVHQIGFVGSVMHGLKQLLSHFSPAQVEEERARLLRRGKSGGGMPWVPRKYRELWEAFTNLYDELSKDEERVFWSFFGQNFAEGYRQYFADLDVQGAPEAAPKHRVGGSLAPPPNPSAMSIPMIQVPAHAPPMPHGVAHPPPHAPGVPHVPQGSNAPGAPGAPGAPPGSPGTVMMPQVSPEDAQRPGPRTGRS